jgi:hypothetical protein
MKKSILSLALGFCVLASPLHAAPIADGAVERLSYSWHLKGGLSWLARLAFPSSGRGTLETRAAETVQSRLTVNASNSKGYYLYESSMLPTATQTLISRSAYAFGGSSRDERVAFDVANRVAHIERTTNAGSESKTHELESAAPQDVLTSIYYLRQHADEIRTARRAEIFSGAKGYNVLYQPEPPTTIRSGNSDVRVRPFSIKPIGTDGNRFPGEVRVWLSDDERKVPVRIDIDQKYGATLKLDLER